MYIITGLGQTASKSACTKYNPLSDFRITDNGFRIIVPEVVKQRKMQRALEMGASLWDAYKAVGLNYPDPAIVPCIKEVLTSRYLAPSGAWEYYEAEFICKYYEKCFYEYLNAYRRFPRPGVSDRRMMIAPDVFIPSPNEEVCIKKDYAVNKNLVSAYTKCGAGDIIPSWSGAIAFISKALDKEYANLLKPLALLYPIIKTSYQISVLPAQDTGAQPTPTPMPTPSPAPDGKGEGKTNLLLFAGIGMAAYLLFKGKA